MKVSLADVTDLLTDGTHYTPPNLGEGVPFLTVKDVSEAGLDFENCSRISRAEFEAANRQNSAPKFGDVLFSKDGTVGKVHLVREEKEFAVLSSLAILRPTTTLDASYLAHFLRTPAALDAAEPRRCSTMTSVGWPSRSSSQCRAGRAYGELMIGLSKKLMLRPPPPVRTQLEGKQEKTPAATLYCAGGLLEETASSSS